MRSQDSLVENSRGGFCMMLTRTLLGQWDIHFPGIRADDHSIGKATAGALKASCIERTSARRCHRKPRAVELWPRPSRQSNPPRNDAASLLVSRGRPQNAAPASSAVRHPREPTLAAPRSGRAATRPRRPVRSRACRACPGYIRRVATRESLPRLSWPLDTAQWLRNFRG
jgi:hypothetical protein